MNSNLPWFATVWSREQISRTSVHISLTTLVPRGTTISPRCGVVLRVTVKLMSPCLLFGPFSSWLPK